MNKTITVYVVTTGEGEEAKSVTFPTKARASEAAKLLNTFGVTANIENVKKTISID